MLLPKRYVPAVRAPRKGLEGPFQFCLSMEHVLVSLCPLHARGQMRDFALHWLLCTVMEAVLLPIIMQTKLSRIIAKTESELQPDRGLCSIEHNISMQCCNLGISIVRHYSSWFETFTGFWIPDSHVGLLTKHCITSDTPSWYTSGLPASYCCVSCARCRCTFFGIVLQPRAHIFIIAIIKHAGFNENTGAASYSHAE